MSSCISKLCQVNRLKDSFDKDTLCLIISPLVLSKLFSLLLVSLVKHFRNECKQVASCSKLCLQDSHKDKEVQSRYSIDDVLKWLPVKEHLLLRDTIRTYMCMNAIAPHDLCSNFCNRASIHGRHTRNSNLLQIPLYSSAFGQKTFKYRAVKIWNRLSSDLKELRIFKNFKIKLGSSLLEKLCNK